MASFDFIEASSKGYEFIWSRRSYLSRLLIPVIFVKIVCLLSVFVLQADERFLLQGLILLPASFLEAVFIVGLVRFIIFSEPIYVWGRPIPLEKKDNSNITISLKASDRRRFMQAGIAVYLLVKVFATASAGVLMDHMEKLQLTPPPETIDPINPVISILLLFGLISGLFWLFRFGWFYIPAAIGYPLKQFMKEISGMRFSFHLVLTYLICLLPIITVFGILLNITAGIFTENSAAFVVGKAFLEACTEMAMLSVQTVAITYGIREVLFGKIEK